MTYVQGSAPALEVIDLRRLAEQYASAADHRDAGRFWGAFDPEDGVLHARNEVRDIGGAERIMEYLSRYDRTFHFIGNTRYDVDGDRAAGEVYCIAHHLTVTGDAGTSNYIMYIRYQDLYRRRRHPGSEPQWRILERRIVVDWTETVAAESGPDVASYSRDAEGDT